MLETTQANLRRSMAVLFIEEKPELIEEMVRRLSETHAKKLSSGRYHPGRFLQ
ncbi:MAG: hypothetical protein CM1200mP36_03710 [Gammaproteobacteria bacterium]|nr:MAG: hypothetical protein CM1200mP36_03710 [Gammaproteobacteria bacterium]